MKRKSQINWADGSSLILVLATTLIGAASGLGGTRDMKSVTAKAIRFVFGGLTGFLIGFAVAQVSGRLAYYVLNLKRLGDVMKAILYLFLPMPFMIGAPLLAAWLVDFVAHFV